MIKGKLMILEQGGGRCQTEGDRFEEGRGGNSLKSLQRVTARKGSFDCAAASLSRSCYCAQDDRIA
jgi:hypothetical protein